MLTCVIVLSILALVYSEPCESQVPRLQTAENMQAHTGPQSLVEGKDDTWFVSIELSIPMTGSVGIAWGRALNDRTTIANFLYYFDRDWMVSLKKVTGIVIAFTQDYRFLLPFRQKESI